MQERFDPEKRGGGYAWAALIGGVAVYDALASETMSNAFTRARQSENPLVRNGVAAAAIYTTLHLFDALGDHDLFDKTFDYLADKFGDYSTKGAHIP